MKFRDFQALVGRETIFRSSLLLTGQSAPNHIRRQLARWVTSGKVISLRRGIYVLAKPYAHRELHPFLVANALRRSSYVSLHSALAHYGMIPEFVPMITSVTTGRPEQLETPLGRFLFRHIKKELFHGVTDVEVSPGQFIHMATKEKALVDLLYLTPGSDDPAYLDELRIEVPGNVIPDEWLAAAERSRSVKVKRGMAWLIRKWRADQEGEERL